VGLDVITGFQKWMTSKGEYTTTPRPLVQKILKVAAVGVVGSLALFTLVLLMIETVVEILAFVL